MLVRLLSHYAGWMIVFPTSSLPNPVMRSDLTLPAAESLASCLSALPIPACDQLLLIDYMVGRYQNSLQLSQAQLRMQQTPGVSYLTGSIAVFHMRYACAAGLQHCDVYMLRYGSMDCST